ncbi:MAG TPA: cell division protein FtsZ [Bacteroidia bacterium]|nr:cell division protein FtsZ [Bacteroidia bacterium]
MQFEIPKERPSIIKVIGIGGGGSNAVNHMFHNVIRGVEFLVCNTDHQALEISPVPHKIQLGPSLTEGRGAGSMPEVGKNAAIENLEDIRKALSGHTKMVFITAGMGGGTGTGAAPIIAGVAREMGILTVAIVTMPFSFEGKKRKQQAEAGIEELKKNVDTLLVICNDKLREIHGNLKLAEAFSYADNVLATAAKSIAEIISVTLHINVDFADVQTVMKESGVAIMGSATASGENRALRAVELALDSPLLNDNNIEGARYILLNITSGSEEVTMDEMGEITDFIQEQAGQTAEVIMGVGTDSKLEKNICVTIIATGFKTKEKIKAERPVEKKVYKLIDYMTEEKKENISEPVAASPLEPYIINNESPEEKIIEEDRVYLEEIPEPVFISPLPVEDEMEEEILPVDFEVETQPKENVFKFDLNTSMPITEAPKEEKKEAEVKETIIKFDLNTSMPVFEIPKQEKKEPEIKEAVFKVDLNTSMPVMEAPKEEIKEKEEVKEEPKEEVVMKTPFVPGSAEIKNTEEKKPVQEPAAPMEDPHEELFRRSRERIMKLKEMNYRLNTPHGLSDLEKEPAYKRRNIKLDDVPSAAENNISKYSLAEDQDKKVEIKPNNFLHDRVD